jgi:hypothetical protein
MAPRMPVCGSFANGVLQSQRDDRQFWSTVMSSRRDSPSILLPVDEFAPVAGACRPAGTQSQSFASFRVPQTND